MLLERSPEYWAREATIEELQEQVRNLPAWNEQVAEVLDFAYVERSMRVLSRTQIGARDEALALADHLERVAHDSARAELAKLRRPYHARWRMLSEIMNRCAALMQTIVNHPKPVIAEVNGLATAGAWLTSGGKRSARVTVLPSANTRVSTTNEPLVPVGSKFVRNS